MITGTVIFDIYSLEQIVQIAIIVCIGAFIQSLVGFGFAIFSMPLMLLTNIELQQAIFITLACQIGQEISGLYCVRKDVNIKQLFGKLWLVVVSGFVFLIIGVMLLKTVEQIDKVYIRRLVSAIILLLIVLNWFVRPGKYRKIGKIWAGLAGSAAGLLTATIGITGPPVVLWVLSQDYTNKETRGSIWLIFLLIMVPTLLLLFFFYPASIPGSLLLTIILTPGVFLISALGVKVGNQFKASLLKRLIYIILIGTALASFAG